MSFTINDFLKLDVINSASVMTKVDTIKNKTIDSISVIELPVENFVHKNELVLTTCIACSDDESTLLNFVKDIYNLGASGLVISLGRYIKYIPEKVIDYCNEINFPIIHIPWEIRFASIVESVLSEINSRKLMKVIIYEKIHKKLLTLFLNGSTLSEVANLIYIELRNPAIIVNSNGKIKGYSKDTSNLLKILEEPLKILSSGENINPLESNFSKDIYTAYKINTKQVTYGYLFLQNKADDNVPNLVANKNLVSQHLIPMISLWFNRKQTIMETEMQYKDIFVWNLIQTKDYQLKDLYIQSQSMGYDLSLSYICLVSTLSNIEESYSLDRSHIYSLEEWRLNCIKEIKGQISRIGQAIKQKVMLTYQEDKLIIFLEANGKEVEKIAKEFIDTVVGRIRLIYPKIVMSWGISSTKVKYDKFNKAYLDGKISLEYASKTRQAGFRYIHYNTSAYRLLSILLKYEETHEIVENIIGQLIKYDQENKGKLIDTFKSYMDNKGNVSQAARKLHLHRQSLLYRLKKIEDITQMSFENSDDLFLLELCIKLWDKKHDLMV